MLINEIISAVLQILVFSLIPFGVYFFRNKTSKGFFEYIGLKKPTRRSAFLAVLASLIFIIGGIGMTWISTDFKHLMMGPETISGQFRQMGFGIEAVTMVFIVAFFKTSLSEEIFFRGFVAKRLISTLGFQKGNMLQAILFGGIHVLLFASMQVDYLLLLFIFLLSGLGAYVIGIINEKIGNGSIVPGWIAHGLGNFISYSITAFLII